MSDNLMLTTRDKTLRAMQLVELEGLKEIDRICREHDIKYSLGGGTCLGQKRHGGVIPWDDDIDVDMVGENYDRFIKIALKELDPNKFFLRCRETDPKHLRSCARLELKGTSLSMQRWDDMGIDAGVFVDIFRWNYLPDDHEIRKKTATKIFIMRCAEHYKMFHAFAKELKKEKQLEVFLYGQFVPFSRIKKIEEKLCNICGDKKTGWIMEDAIIHGDHGGYPSDGIDEYQDDLFEGITIMNKRNSVNFLSKMYGEHYNEWLPPVKRISHHKWTKFDLGEYAKKFNLPEDYQDCMTITYNRQKLEHMQKVSLEMAKTVQDICTKNGLKSYLLGATAFAKLLDIEEMDNMWLEPLVVGMPREDYDKFDKFAQKELGEKYFYQTVETDPNFKFNYARVRLNHTFIREVKMPVKVEDSYNNSFYISVIPLDNTSNVNSERGTHSKKVKYLNQMLEVRWKLNTFSLFKKAKLKKKIEILALKVTTVESLRKLLNKNLQQYSKKETEWLIDSSGYQNQGSILNKNTLGTGKEIEICGYKMIVPEKQEEYIHDMKTTVRKSEDNIYGALLRLADINEKERHNAVERFKDKWIKRIQEAYLVCHLTYFDIPDHQLSILRYDEKQKKVLSNKELFGYE